jgi:flagellar hook-associated protein 3 FlgL
MTRVSDIGTYGQTLSNLRNTQNRIDTLTVQASTGYVSTRYSGVAANSRQLISLESNLSRMSQYKTNNQSVQLRLQTMEQSTTKLVEVATNLKTFLTNALNNENAGDMALTETTDNMLAEASRQLNAKIGDRYLFAGTRIDTAPVDLTSYTTPPTTTPSTADTSYYTGDSTRLTTQAAENYDVSYGATADEPGFEKLMRALKLTNTVTMDPLDRARLNDALDLVNQAIQEIPDITSRIASAQTVLDKVTTDNDDLKVYLNQSVTDITGIDVTEVMTRLTQDQTLLQASYMTISSLSKLNLASYLR